MLTTSLITLPFAGALAVFLLPASKKWVGSLALVVALTELGIWITGFFGKHHFDFGSARIQFEQKHTWISDLGISYHVGLFTFSFWLVGLTTVVMAAAIAYALWAGRERANAYYALMLFLTGAIVCVFSAQDLILFYVAFEAMMIPLYLLIGVWGGERRVAATFKFVAYTMAGSLLMLVTIVVYGLSHGFDLTTASTSSSVWLFLGFAIAFTVKAPLFPLHGWLPDAYREAPPRSPPCFRAWSPRLPPSASCASSSRSSRTVEPARLCTTCELSSSRSRRRGSSTARCSPSGLPIFEVSSPTRAWRR